MRQDIAEKGKKRLAQFGVTPITDKQQSDKRFQLIWETQRDVNYL